MKKLILLFLITIFTNVLFAQSGNVDLAVLGLNGVVKAVKVQSDGKTLLGGQFTDFQGIAQPCLLRLNTDGTRDTSFNPVSISVSTTQPDRDGDLPYISAIAIQSDGKIIIGGNFISPYKRIARLNPNGSLDNSFNPNAVSGILNGGFRYTSPGQICKINAITIQSDGKVLVGGNFYSYDGSNAINNIIRLNSDASKDSTFVTSDTGGSGFNAPVNCIVVQPNGKIIIAGAFTTYRNSDTGNHKLIRLESNGERDWSYNMFSVFTNSNLIPKSIVLLPNGDSLVGGDEAPYLFHIVSSGGTYNPITINGRVSQIELRANNKVLVVGDFTQYEGISVNRMVSLNTDLSVDNTFNIGTGFNAAVSSVAVQADGKIWASGDFTQYNGVNTDYAVRLNGDVTLSNTSFSKNKVIVYPNPTQNILNLTLSETNIATEYEINNVIGEKVSYGNLNSNSISVENLANGVYIIKVKTNEGVLTSKFIKE